MSFWQKKATIFIGPDPLMYIWMWRNYFIKIITPNSDRLLLSVQNTKYKTPGTKRAVNDCNLFPGALFTLYQMDHQIGSKIVLCEHSLNCPLFCRLRLQLHGAIYPADSFVLMLRYWVQLYNTRHSRSSYLYELIRDTGQGPWIERHLNPWQNQAQRTNQKTYLVNLSIVAD